MVSKNPPSSERERIAEAALAKFRRHGIRRVSMDEIARDLRMSKKTLYHHFTGKEDLVRGCAQTVAAAMFPEIERVLGQAGSARERLMGVWQVFSTLPRFISSEMMADLKTDYPTVWNEIHTRRMEVFRHIETLVEQGIHSGEVWPEIHPRVFAALLRAVLEHVMVPEVLMAYEVTPSDAVSTLIALFQKGLLTTAPPAPRSQATRGRARSAKK